VQKIQQRQLVDHLRKVVFRGIASLRDFGLTHKPTGIDRTIHQGAHSKTGSGGQAHFWLPSLSNARFLGGFAMSGHDPCTKSLRDKALVLGVVLIWDLFRVL